MVKTFTINIEQTNPKSLLSFSSGLHDIITKLADKKEIRKKRKKVAVDYEYNAQVESKPKEQPKKQNQSKFTPAPQINTQSWSHKNITQEQTTKELKRLLNNFKPKEEKFIQEPQFKPSEKGGTLPKHLIKEQVEIKNSPLSHSQTKDKYLGVAPTKPEEKIKCLVVNHTEKHFSLGKEINTRKKLQEFYNYRAFGCRGVQGTSIKDILGGCKGYNPITDKTCDLCLKECEDLKKAEELSKNVNNEPVFLFFPKKFPLKKHTVHKPIEIKGQKGEEFCVQCAECGKNMIFPAEPPDCPNGCLERMDFCKHGVACQSSNPTIPAKYIKKMEEKRCSDCHILINSGDSFYAATMLCNDCYLKNKREGFISNQTREEREKDYHCNNCGLLIKECDYNAPCSLCGKNEEEIEKCSSCNSKIENESSQIKIIWGEEDLPMREVEIDEKSFEAYHLRVIEERLNDILKRGGTKQFSLTFWETRCLEDSSKEYAKSSSLVRIKDLMNYIKYSNIPDFVRNDIVREIMNQNKDYLLSENETEGYALIQIGKNISSEELLDEFVRRVELGAIKVSSRYLYDTEECEIRFFTDYKIIEPAGVGKVNIYCFVFVRGEEKCFANFAVKDNEESVEEHNGMLTVPKLGFWELDKLLHTSKM
ncbi:33651_t:CDS:10 [Gigaspora margarita]|uniref:33651_t:CDS:1 n=1 Tax=Gigaspora margarita TaxID=4874 RepID=A0ABM8VXM0_GIGMA|nr:33651_t:CDS:10 [Gigaspora margarita]